MFNMNLYFWVISEEFFMVITFTKSRIVSNRYWISEFFHISATSLLRLRLASATSTARTSTTSSTTSSAPASTCLLANRYIHLYHI